MLGLFSSCGLRSPCHRDQADALDIGAEHQGADRSQRVTIDGPQMDRLAGAPSGHGVPASSAARIVSDHGM